MFRKYLRLKNLPRFNAVVRRVKPTDRRTTIFITTVMPIVAYFCYYTTSDPILLDVKHAYAITDVDKKIAPEELMKHRSRDDLWVVIHGKVYDLTEFAKRHPGSEAVILKYAGKDATDAFRKIHSVDVIGRLLEPQFQLGILDGELAKEEEDGENIMTEEELQLVERFKNKPDIEHIFNVSDFEYVAKQLLPKGLYSYFATGSDEEFTLRNNHYAYQRIFFKPRVLTDTKNVDLSTNMCGAKVSLPIYVSAFAGQGKADGDGELNVTRVTQRHDIIQMIPIMSSKTMEEIQAETSKSQVQWHQLHFESLYDYKQAENNIKRLCNYENVKAIFINADLAAESNREKDFKMRNMEQNREFDEFSNPTNVYPTLSWDDFLRFKQLSSKPLLIKGVQHPEDIIKLAELGFRGVVISNHGGRQLDFGKPPLEILAETMPKLRECEFYDKEKFDVYIDGGVRRGTDIIKALSLGATGVGLGRPVAYALASYGEAGCERLIGLLKDELERDMKLLGCNDVKKLNESYLDTSGLYNRFNTEDKIYNLLYEPMQFPQFKNE